MTVETKGRCGKCKADKRILFICNNCQVLSCATCEAKDTKAIRACVTSEGKFTCKDCTDDNNSGSLSLEMLAKELRSLRKTVEEKADRKDILEQLTEMRRENTELRDENVMLKDKIAKMTSRVAKEAKTEVRSYVDSVVKNLPASSAGRVTYKEVEDRSDRKLNIIIRGVRESENEEGLDRKEDDRKSVIRVCALTGAVEEPDMAESILSIRRLGKYDKERHFRPILLKLSRSDLREKLVRTGRRMKELNKANQTRYRIEADLTKEQSENYQEMWKKADTQSGNGVKYYVTGPRENPSLRSREMTEEEKEAGESKKDKEED
jgi:hypothetical protein